MSKEEQMGEIILAFNDAYKTLDWKSVVKESTGFVQSDEAYETYIPRIYDFNKKVYTKAFETVKENTNDIDEFEIVDNESDIDKTGFYSNTFISSANNVFGGEEAKEKVVDEEIEDNVSDQSVLIPKKEFYAEVEEKESRPVDSFTEALTPVVEEETEAVSYEEEKTTAKVKKLGKKAAYVDTVILCLIAQLSIFGLLIIVLLIIK